MYTLYCLFLAFLRSSFRCGMYNQLLYTYKIVQVWVFLLVQIFTYFYLSDGRWAVLHDWLFSFSVLVWSQLPCLQPEFSPSFQLHNCFSLVHGSSWARLSYCICSNPALLHNILNEYKWQNSLVLRWNRQSSAALPVGKPGQFLIYGLFTPPSLLVLFLAFFFLCGLAVHTWHTQFTILSR